MSFTHTGLDNSMPIHRDMSFTNETTSPVDGYDSTIPQVMLLSAAIPVAQSLPPTSTANISTTPQRVPCTQTGCSRTFPRRSDIQSHVGSAHGNHRQIFCPHMGCAKSQGAGFSRRDKLSTRLQATHGAPSRRRGAQGSVQNA
jgi:hypothetical protein